MKIRNGVGILALATIALGAIAVASCGGGAEDAWTDESGLLKYIPADSPYVFAQGEVPPDELMDKLAEWVEPLLTAYQEVLRTAVDQASSDFVLGAEERQRMEGLLNIASEFLTVEGLESAGFTRDSRMVIYGNGLLPVLRVTVTDGAALEATVARIEAAAGTPSPVAALGAQSYRYWGDDEARIVMAIVGNEFVLTVSPTSLADRHLGMILGDELPAENIAASGKLAEIAAKYEFGPHYLGFLDMQRIAAVFLGAPSGIDADLLALMEYDPSIMSNVCRTEIAEMAGVAPRFVAGYTRLDAEQMDWNAVIELRPDIAAGLMPIAAPVPGLGTLRAGLLSFGMGVDLRAARDFALARLDALEADPYQCELFAGLSAEIPSARMALSQPVPLEAYDLKGFVLAIDEIGDLGSIVNGQVPPELRLRFLLASDNAPGLVAMGAMFSPEVAALEANGEPVRLNLPIPLPVPLDIWAAMTPEAIALAVGPDAAARLQELLEAPASDLTPFMSWDMNYRRYLELMSELIDVGVAVDPTATPELMEPFRQIMTQLAAGPLERETMNLRFTENGVELPSTVTLSD